METLEQLGQLIVRYLNTGGDGARVVIREERIVHAAHTRCAAGDHCADIQAAVERLCLEYGLVADEVLGVGYDFKMQD